MRLQVVIAYSVPLVIANNTFRTDVTLAVLAVVLGLLLGVLQAKLIARILLWLVSVAGINLLYLWDAVEARAYATKLVDFLLVVNVV